MIPAGAIAHLRAVAETNMPERWRCQRAGGRRYDDVTAKDWVENPPQTIYDGPGRLDDTSTLAASRRLSQGERSATSSLILSLPVHDSSVLRIGDVLERVALDPDSPTEDEVGRDGSAPVGTRVKVTDLHFQTQSSERRLPVEIESWPTS